MTKSISEIIGKAKTQIAGYAGEEYISDAEIARMMEEYADQQSVMLAKRVIEGLAYYGCTISEDNAGYAYFIAGSGIHKGMNADHLVEHLTQSNLMDQQSAKE